ncbi:hypothetical protein TBS_18680 [Thermobispora bispora]
MRRRKMTSSGQVSPRLVRPVRKSLHASVESPAAAARPTKTGLPSVVMPQAASTGSASCIRKWLASRKR